ncbi:hypothetical protein QBC35DRAFT_503643 [Podospora australis]|uniref:GH64 domain-containing protein n=1 Tax=Podospora australis TaxID=1536484 RepID=A0AAN6WQ98_9PEZI|nr:hypothetical protein QBC35DRAFT_503643 [Podospora australis]
MPASLTIQLVNNSTTPNISAFITGLAMQHSMRRVFVLPSGELYFPENPPAGQILQPLTQNPAIPLGAPGNKVTVTIPQIAGGRIWFSAEKPLVFLRNPGGPGGGAALVEPSVLNPTDLNAATDFCFMEFTLNNDQLFANISYVDFVPRLPVALTLRTKGGQVQHVSGMAPDGLERAAQKLKEQAHKDGRPWDKLAVVKDGRTLRVLSPTHGNAVGASFDGYYEPLVEEVWNKYAEGQSISASAPVHHDEGEKKKQHRLSSLLSGLLKSKAANGNAQEPDQHHHPQHHHQQCMLSINTQAAPGVVSGCVEAKSGHLVIGGEAFKKPTTADILGCNSGPFTTGPSPKRNAIIPRLAAAFQRSCITSVMEHPSLPETFYRCDPTNHYCRVVHECNLDGKGYAFAYDDVQPDGGDDQSGKVNAGDPEVFIVAVGGQGAYVGDRMP